MSGLAPVFLSPLVTDITEPRQAASALLTSIKVSMLVTEPPLSIFLAVRLRNLELRSAMEPSSLRAGWSGGLGFWNGQ